jgi:hypothetical protein
MRSRAVTIVTAEKPVAVSFDEAVAMLAITEDYDPGGTEGPGPCVHTFRSTPLGLLGAHWRLESLKAAMEQFGVERSGEMAVGMRHGLVLTDDTGPLFLETKSPA